MTKGIKNPVTEKTIPVIVIFRKWKDTGSILALFPTIPGDIWGDHCMSYEHIGQHGAADYGHCMMQTVPAEAVECVELANELRQRGYELRVRARADYRMHQVRRAEASTWRHRDRHPPAPANRGKNTVRILQRQKIITTFATDDQELTDAIRKHVDTLASKLRDAGKMEVGYYDVAIVSSAGGVLEQEILVV